MPELRAIPVPGIPEIKPGDRIAPLILNALNKSGIAVEAGDILVVTHKIISKAEGALVPLDTIRPSPWAHGWAKRFHLDARVAELALSQARRVVRRKNGVMITETGHGLVCANSGVDVSNVDGGRTAVLLPRDSDASARSLHSALRAELGFAVPVIISDTFGRPWREGLTEVAIGVAGMKPFRDFRARRDAHGYHLRVTLEAVADELAGMAGLACGKLSGIPVCLIRGFVYRAGKASARELIRDKKRDLFR